MDGLFSWVVKGTLIVIFAPLLLCLVLQGAVAVLAAILPWLVALGVVSGLVAGISAGLVIRRRLPPRWEGGTLPPGTEPRAYRVRRERGGGGRRAR
jgi:hypothetical protein